MYFMTSGDREGSKQIPQPRKYYPHGAMRQKDEEYGWEDGAKTLVATSSRGI
jgi:hypothetical protein